MTAAGTVRRARERAGLSQAELASRVGMQQPAVARIESGRVTPTVDTFARLLQGCGETLIAADIGALEADDVRLLLHRMLRSAAQRDAVRRTMGDLRASVAGLDEGDRTLLAANLRLTPRERVEQLVAMSDVADRFRRGRRLG